MNLKDLKIGQTVVASDEAEWGFDLTSISAAAWKKMLKEVGVSDKPMHKDNIMWVWVGKNIRIHTGNNPITGKFGQLDRREDEKDYASYIGIYGDKALVEKAAKMIGETATDIKDETPNRSNFI